MSLVLYSMPFYSAMNTRMALKKRKRCMQSIVRQLTQAHTSILCICVVFTLNCVLNISPQFYVSQYSFLCHIVVWFVFSLALFLSLSLFRLVDCQSYLLWNCGDWFLLRCWPEQSTHTHRHTISKCICWHLFSINLFVRIFSKTISDSHYSQ